MWTIRIRSAELIAVLFVLSWTSATLAQQATTPLAQTCQQRGIFLGPHRFEKLLDKPFKLNVETCLDGTAWSDLFNFNLRFAAKLDNVQQSVDAFVNQQTNKCEGRDLSVKVTSLDVESQPAVREQQAMKLSISADMLQCSFPYVGAELSIDVPLALNT